MAASHPVPWCDTCKEKSESSDASVLCKECRELYCTDCGSVHKTFKATKDHLIVKVTQTVNDRNSVEPECDTCSQRGKGKVLATVLCLDCRELYCDSCKQHHVIFKATKNHGLHHMTKSYGAIQPVEVDSVNLSSDFEGFNIATEKEILGAQVPVLSSNDRGNRRSKHLDRKDMDKISATIISKFNAKVTSDENGCNFKGIICLKDGRLLLLDYDNRKLKMFNQTFQLLCDEPTEVPGTGMTKISEQEIAVVSGQTVYFFKITSDKFVLQDKVFELGAIGSGISFNRDIYAITCDVTRKDAFIKICSGTGQELHRITSFKKAPGWRIYLDSEHDSIYLQSKDITKFSCLSQQGQIKWEMDFDNYNVVELFNCLLVTSTGGEVILCTKDGTYWKSLIKDNKNLLSIRHISYNSDTQQLFATCDQDNLVKVLSLSF